MSTSRVERQPALVTGASSGIGAALARVLAQNGHDVFLVARSADALVERCASLTREFGVRAEPLPFDLTRREAPQELHRALRDLRAQIGILVNDAGVAVHGAFGRTDLAAELELIQLNVAALTHLTKLMLGAMQARQAGRILNVASTAAYVPGPFMAVYYASKAYVLSLSVALAEELADSGITVTALCPGPTRTPFEQKSGVGRTPLFRGGNVLDPERVALAGYRGLMAGRRVVIPGFRNKLLAAAAGLGPKRIAARITRAWQEPDL
ncbi:SDR family NAD(P)-dependent oxidoreductase [Anaeromyxobacter paludicola]|uniref:Short-chain dehydrogenase n=1 Tax=Anaeromyxobacter paludicola TaxID=2918171 RepID=A0ABN6NFP3_9BACT|nr:SDR family oxidoreductase [Anaeromyxobacter paludicola]BDG10867.1 short-chain dehydrogenase [Anaeromyxobacter paludicola]